MTVFVVAFILIKVLSTCLASLRKVSPVIRAPDSFFCFVLFAVFGEVASSAQKSSSKAGVTFCSLKPPTGLADSLSSAS